MDYPDAVEALRIALAFGIHPSLDGIEALCEELGRPQDAFGVIQVTGTNGKTSTVRFVQAMLGAEGLSTGLYTSPHLERYEERIELSGVPVAEVEFGQAIGEVMAAADQLRPGAHGTPEGFTEFEILTAAALWLFRQHAVDVAVLEVGLGGRWDATSIATPAVAVVTGVGLDHTAILGDTLEQIAEEKAAIIRPGSVAVLGPGTQSVEDIFLHAVEAAGAGIRVVRHNSAPSVVSQDLTVRFILTDPPTAPDDFAVLNVAGVLGDYPALSMAAPAYQAANVATAIAAAEAFLGRELDDPLLRQAVAGVSLPARFELVRSVPPVIVDGSHNPQAAAVLAGAIANAWPDDSRRPTVLLGVLSDKDATGIVRELATVCSSFAVTQPQSERRLPARELGIITEAVTGVAPRVFPDVASALAELIPAEREGVVIAGSLTTAGEARGLLLHAFPPSS